MELEALSEVRRINKSFKESQMKTMWSRTAEAGQPVIKPVSSNQFSYHKHQLFRKVIENFLFWCDTHEVTHQHKIVLLLFYCFSIGEIS